MRLALECIGHFECLLQVQPGLAHFLDGHKLVMKQGILRLVDGSHAQLANDMVAFLQQVTLKESPGRDVVGGERSASLQSMAAGKTKCCLPFISGSTMRAIEGERRSHITCSLRTIPWEPITARSSSRYLREQCPERPLSPPPAWPKAVRPAYLTSQAQAREPHLAATI